MTESVEDSAAGVNGPVEEGPRSFRMAFKFRLYPTSEQEEAMQANIDATRYVYNRFLRERIDAYERTQPTLTRMRVDADGEPVLDEKGKRIYDEAVNETYDPDAKPLSYYDTSRMLTAIKKEVVGEDGTYFLKEADAIALGYALRNLDAAYKNFFRNVKRGGEAGYPRFKKRGSAGAYKTTARGSKGLLVRPPAHGEKLASICLPKVGWVPMMLHRQVKGAPVSVAISRSSSGRWYASISVKEVEIEPAPVIDRPMVGIATGVEPWIETSDGVVVSSPRISRRYEKRLARAEKKKARKVKGSNNYRKQCRRIARIHEKMEAARRDATHNATRELVDTYQFMAVRDMDVKSMMEGKPLPGKAGRRLKTSIADANLAEINRQLDYKAAWTGRTVVHVPGDTPTVQVCPSCGERNEVLASDLKPSWVCPKCGKIWHRRGAAAQNVLMCGEDILHGTEHASATRARKEKRAERKRKKESGEKAA